MEIPYTVYGFAMRIARLFFNRNKGVGKDFGLDGIQKKGFLVHSSWFGKAVLGLTHS
jgi:hypothetical protein